MAERNLAQIISQLKHSPSMSYPEANALLSKAKLALLKLNALTPAPSTPTHLLPLARETYEQGALFAIRARNPEAFTRYVQQLQPFYELPAAVLPPNLPERNKVTGLSLLLLLTQGRYAEFHTELESLENREGGGSDVESDRYLGYPIRLERWLMEGSYDRVWKAMKSSEVPCDEYSVFSEVSLPICPISAQAANIDPIVDPQEPDPLRDCFQQRARIPQPSYQLHKVPSLLGLRGRCYLFRPPPWLDRP
jgi:26S proteasome regulatory subunit N12